MWEVHLRISVLTRNSFVRRYVTMVVRLEKKGARNTHTFLMSIVTFTSHARWYNTADVTISPG
jgi:hypothetical protein